MRNFFRADPAHGFAYAHEAHAEVLGLLTQATDVLFVWLIQRSFSAHAGVAEIGTALFILVNQEHVGGENPWLILNERDDVA